TSEYENRDPRMTMTMIVPGLITNRPLYTDPVINYPFFPQRVGNTGYNCFKYMSELKYDRPRNNSNDYDHHLIRYSEVLLIYAEAVFERNGSISDDDLDKTINIIRNRVEMPPLTNQFILNNGLDMKEEIRRERTIELALEGFRYDDLRRWKTAETELTKPIKGINIKIPDWQQEVLDDGVVNLYSDETWQNNTDENGFILSEEAPRYFDPAKHYLRPIPTKEILINPNLEQNPGW
ncbi:MAG: RagB/SusD family nutrient uptake outer membrane protein, partial [Cyclobacteriaceae bacterium]